MGRQWRLLSYKSLWKFDNFSYIQGKNNIFPTFIYYIIIMKSREEISQDKIISTKLYV